MGTSITTTIMRFTALTRPYCKHGGGKMSQTKRAANIFNPKSLSEEELVNNFIIRLGEFKSLYQEIIDFPWDRPGQHYIIQGARGSGKTTLLYRLFYEFRKEKKTFPFLVPIIFNEEQYHLRSLGRLWEDVAEELEEIKGFAGLRQKIEDLYETGEYDEKAFILLASALKKQKKKILLFFDNIGDVLNRLSDQENARFREILLTSPDIRIVAASSIILEDNNAYGKPFYEFFKFIHLKELKQPDCTKLFMKLADSLGQPEASKIATEQPERLEILRRLSGGVPRTIVLLFEIASDEEGDALQDLEQLLDRVTPLYKHRMDDLSSQQQHIVDVIAIHWDAITTGEIAKKVRMESKAVSSQLKQLERNRIVTAIKTDTKNRLYQISERFFNIWYLMRCGRNRDCHRVEWLVRFLQSWFSQEELVVRAKKHVKSMEKKSHHPQHAYFMAEALSRAGLPRKEEHYLKEMTREYLTIHDKNLAKELSPSDKELWEKASKYYFEEDWQASLKILEKISNKDGLFYGAMGELYAELKKRDKAEACLKKAIVKGNVEAISYLGWLHHAEYKDFVQAEKYYLMAIEKGNTIAMNNLGVIYQDEYKDFVLAEKYYQMAIEKGNVETMNNLGWLYFETKKQRKKALELISSACSKEKDVLYLDYLVCVKLWNNKLENLEKDIEKVLLNEEIIKTKLGAVQLMFMLLIAKMQYHTALKFFERDDFQLRDRMKPLYFALMCLMKDERPNEWKKAGSELSETIEEIIAKINQLAIDYE
ncbi:MAG: hypothetical protein HQK84_07630 [Nitrospinae bacterium]|nr:hypothetical protein [Nitrospinota bacterium]